jgi:hypothetical protein
MSLIASMVTMSISAQNPSKRPSLVVGIMIEGLDQTYIDQLRSYFGDKGFNRMLNEGIVLQKVDYGTPLDKIAATAMIYTGAAPSVNGIPSQEVFDNDKGIAYPILLDPSKIGNYTDETYSPVAISVSTLSDEIINLPELASGSTAGLVYQGAGSDVTINNGIITVNDDSHTHTKFNNDV